MYGIIIGTWAAEGTSRMSLLVWCRDKSTSRFSSFLFLSLSGNKIIAITFPVALGSCEVSQAPHAACILTLVAGWCQVLHL